MAIYEEASLLLAAAKRDLRALQGMLNPAVFADEIFGFHAQQAVEKALKSWLAFLDVQYPRTHDLTLLLTLLEAHGQEVSDFQDMTELNPYAVQYRYGAFDEMIGFIDRLAIINRVHKLTALVDSHISPKSWSSLVED